MNSLLDFRTLLSIMAIIFRDGEFTARDLSDRMREATHVIALNSPQALEFLQRFRTKLISNDLRRLYAMGFLKRRRVKRECRTKSGKVCFRGYEYRYSISSQGWKYLRYLQEGREEDVKKLEDLLTMLFIKKKIPEDRQDLAWEFYRIHLSGRDGFRRFSSSERAFWERLLEKAWKLTEVKELERRIEELEREKKRLEEENRRLKEISRTFYRLHQELKRSWEEDPQRFAALLFVILESIE